MNILNCFCNTSCSSLKNFTVKWLHARGNKLMEKFMMKNKADVFFMQTKFVSLLLF